ncbi:Peptide chain release factor N(5)-glutamine methyltransferase [Alteripontixanthobacter maritimus]|uniref:Release factor glutamine methyltransferase n=1 Tax=Alteripontixanthobacter maritimus TaxID=2161824 RepID=A0A369QCI8_9SPHN|nr:peptide chain release factor N(5)-glutamine methyltransferase [Alteripontixanthobacter maritimus]RDC60956.1 Peptide chain release factor N(5)-glutamine methyltransferase [Alteripontixanthobacter maritimus]
MRDAAAQLADTSDTARLDAELLMGHALGIDRSTLLLDRMADNTPPIFAELVARRAAHEPVAYIIGEAEFYGRTFAVNSDVLIPRSDTETLIDAVAGDERLRELARATGARILDCGTGSGALLLTLLAEYPQATGMGVERSLGAVTLAALNAARLGVADRAQIDHLDWHDPNWCDGLGRFSLIVANPPYVETEASLAPGVARFEPVGALYAGVDGLDDYRVLIPRFRALLRDDGAVLLEIGRDQAQAVAKLAESAGFQTELRRDLAGRPRVLILQSPT